MRLLSIGVLVLVCAAASPPATAQGVLPLYQPGKTSQSQGQGQGQGGPAHADFQQSLSVVIETLQNRARRHALLKQLKALQQAAKTGTTAQQAAKNDQASLLETLTGAALANEGLQALEFVWGQRTQRALQVAHTLLTEGRWRAVRDTLVRAAVALAAGLVALLLLVFGGRGLFRRLDWPLSLPRHPRVRSAVAHLLRRILPWALSFLGLFWALRALSAPAGVQAIALSVAYMGLCGQALATVIEVIICWYAEGHRRVAARILLRRTLYPFFAIGALLALGDAADGEAVQQLLHPDLAQWLSAVANLIAAAIAGWLVLHNRRPVAHLIRNRAYWRRARQGVVGDLIVLLSRVWWLPALFAVACAVAGLLITGADRVFSRAALSAALLLGTLIANGLLFRHRARIVQRRIRGEDRKRLVRFGYALVAFLCWVIFAELVLWVWGYSLFGLGTQPGGSSLFGRILLGVGLTALLAWLVWIFADIAISRALRGSQRHSGKASARAQTVTPMVRTVVFCIIIVIAAVVALANLGVNVTPLLAGAGIIGLAVGFGAQNLVQDLITGMFIVIEDSIAVGDFIQVGQYMGTVEGLNLRTVRLRDLDAVVHHITYSHIDSIHNMSRDFGIALLKIRIPHDMPIDDAVTLMRETSMELRKDPWIGSLIRSPLEMQGVHSFEDGCPILRMRMRTTPEWQWDVGRAFNQLLKQRMERQQVTLGAPRLTISMAAEGGSVYGQETGPAAE